MFKNDYTKVNSTVTGLANFGFTPLLWCSLGSLGVFRESKLSTEFEFGTLVR
jgi:hypothetical protein